MAFASRALRFRRRNDGAEDNDRAESSGVVNRTTGVWLNHAVLFDQSPRTREHNTAGVRRACPSW
jgi:hypothetical protein